jgi:hypothetical protein
LNPQIAKVFFKHLIIEEAFYYKITFCSLQSIIDVLACNQDYNNEGGIMKLSEYFEKNRGIGVFSTVDSSGKVNAALYGRPHFMDEETVVFIAADRLTHANLQTNPHAVYLFSVHPETVTV